MKLEADKYYTNPLLCKACIEIVKEVIGEENITEWVEPSAGSGTFSRQIEGCKAFDLYPQHHSIKEADYLTLDLGGYKKGRVIIGNPPFGRSNHLIKAFYKKASIEAEYVAFILPISQYENNECLYKTELIYSKIIKAKFTNEQLNCCFNIYKKTPECTDYRNKDYKLQDVECIWYIRSNKKEKHKLVEPYDYCVNAYGAGGAFKPAKPYEYALTIGFKINNDKIKDDIIGLMQYMNNKRIKKQLFSISTIGIERKYLYKLFKNYIPEIK